MTKQMEVWGSMEAPRRYLIDLVCGGSSGVNQFTVSQLQDLNEDFAPTLQDVENRLYRIHQKATCVVKGYHGRLADCLGDNKRKTFFRAHVELDGRVTQIGIADEEGSTVAHRFLGSDRWLKVHFPDAKGEENMDQFKTLCSCNIEIGLRKFAYFGHKDPEKSGDEAKCYFFALSSRALSDILDQNFVQYSTMDDVRMQLGHFQSCGTIQKMAARLALPFSSTHPLGAPLTEDMVAVVPDIQCVSEDGKITLPTDGSGFILEDIVPEIEVENGQLSQNTNTTKPTVLQVRGYSGGSIFKGTLLNVKKIPDGVLSQISLDCRDSVKIVIRESMLKVKKVSKDLPMGPQSLEICKTSRKEKNTKLNQTINLLLAHGGVSQEVFLGLLKDEIEDIVDVTTDRNSAMQVLRNYGADLSGKRMNLIFTMLVSNISLSDPYLRNGLRKLQQDGLEQVRDGRLHIPNTYYIMGVPDPIGLLEEHQVMVLREGRRECGECLVYRHPSRLMSSVRRLCAVDSSEIMEILGPTASFCIVFSTKGRRSVTDTMGGGDLDGDFFWVTFHPELVSSFKNEEPKPSPGRLSQSRTLPIPDNIERRDDLLIQTFARARCTRNKLGNISNLLLAWMDHLGPNHLKCLQLNELYESQLDSAKTGEEVSVPFALRDPPWPHFMEKEGNAKLSTSIAGVIYDYTKGFLVPSEALQGLDHDPDLVLSEREEWPRELEEAQRIMKRYNFEISKACDLAGTEKSQRCAQIQENFQKELYNGWRCTFEEPIAPFRLLLRASAMYFVSYKHAQEKLHIKQQNGEFSTIGTLSMSFADLLKLDKHPVTFPWEVAGFLLCELKSRRGKPRLYDINAVFESFRKKRKNKKDS